MNFTPSVKLVYFTSLSNQYWKMGSLPGYQFSTYPICNTAYFKITRVNLRPRNNEMYVLRPHTAWLLTQQIGSVAECSLYKMSTGRKISLLLNVFCYTITLFMFLCMFLPFFSQ